MQLWIHLSMQGRNESDIHNSLYRIEKDRIGILSECSHHDDVAGTGYRGDQ